MKDFLDMSSVFLDTNFFLDVFDTKRERHNQAKEVLNSFLDNDMELYTSSDIISTISYFLQKKLNLKSTVINIDFIVQQVSILVATNEDFMELNKMILEKIEEDNSLKIDYEDCMQLFLANKHKVKNILTSDKGFCKGVKQEYDILIVALDDALVDYH
jgi:predicted nucleic acid-binding protein